MNAHEREVKEGRGIPKRLIDENSQEIREGRATESAHVSEKGEKKSQVERRGKSAAQFSSGKCR